MKPTTWADVMRAARGLADKLTPSAVAGQDEHVLAVLYEALSYVANDRTIGAGRTAEARQNFRRAHAALIGGAKGAARDLIAKTIDEAVVLSRVIGPEEAARALASTLRVERTRLPELARRLAGHRVPTKQGRAKAGTYSTRQIAEWVTGEHEIARHISRRRKK